MLSSWGGARLNGCLDVVLLFFPPLFLFRMDTIIAENLRIINEANDALMARMAPMGIVRVSSSKTLKLTK